MDLQDDRQVNVSASDYGALLDRIRAETRVRWNDKGGRECYLVLDQDGFPHREDVPAPYGYVQLSVTSLEDLCLVMLIFSANPRSHFSL